MTARVADHSETIFSIGDPEMVSEQSRYYRIGFAGHQCCGATQMLSAGKRDRYRYLRTKVMSSGCECPHPRRIETPVFPLLPLYYKVMQVSELLDMSDKRFRKCRLGSLGTCPGSLQNCATNDEGLLSETCSLHDNEAVRPNAGWMTKFTKQCSICCT